MRKPASAAAGVRFITRGPPGETVILITAYPKVDKDDLTADEKKMFADLIKELTGDEENPSRR